MPQLLTKNSGKKHPRTEVKFDFTKKGNYKSFNKSVINHLKKVSGSILIIDYIYPVRTLKSKSYEVFDHVNLSGFNPLKGATFIPLSNIYLSKKGIVVAGLKNGTHPNNIEKRVLSKCSIETYCYNIVPTAIYATYLGIKIKAVGIVKDIHI